MKPINLMLHVAILTQRPDLYCVIKKMVLPLLATLLLTGVLHAEQVKEMNQLLAGMESSGNDADRLNADRLQTLVLSSVPTIYGTNGEVVNSSSQAAVRCDFDKNSLSRLYDPDESYGTTELLIIRIKSEADLTFSLHLQELQSFSRLKYVCFLCEFSCSEASLSTLFSPKEGIVVFYLVSIPS